MAVDSPTLGSVSCIILLHLILSQHPPPSIPSSPILLPLKVKAIKITVKRNSFFENSPYKVVLLQVVFYWNQLTVDSGDPLQYHDSILTLLLGQT
jgi:hypothetical protein